MRAHYGWRELFAGTRRSEPVVWTDNGNRARHPEAVLRRLRRLMPRVGVTRVAEIAPLLDTPIAVFQAVRPDVLMHGGTGQNTGSQGKGRTRIQARLSAMMESLESYCAEPRDPVLVRGSFEFLRHQHVLLDPIHYVHRYGIAPVAADEPLMWTEGCCLRSGERVLVPAEAVYFPFLPHDFETRPIFSCSTNGLASGSTYLEAVTHGLYEVIERHYTAFAHLGRAAVHQLPPEEVGRDKLAQGRFFTLHLPGENLPMVLCQARDAQGRRFIGAGCCAGVEAAIDRALTEAVQAMSTAVSGAREDLDGKRRRTVDLGPGGAREFLKMRLPEAPDLSLHEYSAATDRQFSDLRDEFEFLLAWLASAGFPNVFAANLTRRGIDVPVVKIIIPGMMSKLEFLLPARRWTSSRVQRLRFSFDLEAMAADGFR